MFGKKEENKTDELPVKKVRRRKKAETSKPWGKLERIIIFIFLLAAPILSIIFLTQAKESKISIPIPVQASPKNTNQLKTDLTNKIKNLKGTYGVWVQALDNSYSVGIAENNNFDGASLLKLPLMIAYYKSVDDGSIDPNTNYTLKYVDAAAGAGILANMPPGTTISYKDIVNTMGKNSDNSAFSIMYNILGTSNVLKVINEIGMKKTDFNNSITTPFDTGLLFYKLVNSNLISENSRKELFSSLTNTDFENLIPAGIPDTVRVVHKFGSNGGELNDAGIVYTNKPFILVVLSKNDSKEALSEIPKIAELVYNWAK